jgi:hypothetical protein
VPSLQLNLTLPDRKSWVPASERSSFLVLDHAATTSRLVVGVWRETEPMTRELCEERARSRREFPPSNGDATSIAAPRGFDTRVEVGVFATRPGEPLRGHLLAFGAEARRCFALVFTTEAQGPEAERRIAERLAVIEGITLRQIRLLRDLP